MKKPQGDRALELANYIINNNATISQTAKRFAISKSTVHRDVTERLKMINEDKYRDVSQILEQKKLKHIIIGYSPDKDLTTSPPIIRKPAKSNIYKDELSVIESETSKVKH